MQLAHLWLTDFRGHEASEVEVGPGITVFAGGNAQGKTTVLEAVGWLARMSSFRGAPDSALVRVGCEKAIVRAEIVPANRGPDVRPDLIEAEIAAAGRNRVLLNRKPLPRARDLLGTLRVTVFAPDDLRLVKAGPAERRAELDDLLVALSPRYDAVQADYDRVLKHRNAWLRTWSPGRRPGHARRVGRAAGAGGGGAGPGPAQAARTAGRPPRQGLRRCGRRAPPTWPAPTRRPGPVRVTPRRDPARRHRPAPGGGGGPVPGGRPRAPAHPGRSPPGRLAALRSTGSTPAGSPPRASSGRWRWPCAWPGTLSFPRSWASRPSCCSTMCSPSSTRAGRANLVAHLPIAQALVTTAGALPPGLPAERVIWVAGGRLEPGTTTVSPERGWEFRERSWEPDHPAAPPARGSAVRGRGRPAPRRSRRRRRRHVRLAGGGGRGGGRPRPAPAAPRRGAAGRGRCSGLGDPAALPARRICSAGWAARSAPEW